MSRKTVSSEEYEVEKVLDMQKKKNGTVMYKVKWFGYDISESTWEPEENLENAKELIRNYIRDLGNQEGKKLEIKISKPVEPVKPTLALPAENDSVLNKKRKKEKEQKAPVAPVVPPQKKEIEKKCDQVEVDLSHCLVIEGNLNTNSPLKIVGVSQNKKCSTYDYYVEWKPNSAGIKPKDSKIDSFEFVKHRPDFLVSYLESNIKIKK